MRIRSIKPEFWTSEDIADLTWAERLLFIGLWSYVDDNGVGRDLPKLICADLFPLEESPRDTLATVSSGLARLAEAGLIVRYTVEGKPYLYIATWTKHQRIDRPAKARYPRPTSENTDPREGDATPSRHSRDTPSPGAVEQGSRGTEEQGAARASARLSLPADFAVTDDMRTWATEKGYEHLDLDVVTEKFIDHHTAAGSTKVDWLAAWRSWVRNERTDGAHHPETRPAFDGWDQGMPPEPCAECNAPHEIGHYDGCPQDAP